MDNANLPLAGITVVEFSHMVMGPVVGLMLADLGADVLKIEPIGGDKTRNLRGSGAGYFSMYNRNKRSLCLDLKSAKGKQIARSLALHADVLLENFRPGAMEKLGFGYADLSKDNPRLIYCSARGFLKGPYEHRTALDEVTQMMGGLAYMTGPPGRPLRAGASVIDVTGGMFGAIGVLAALQQRQHTGKGQQVTSALFETTAFLVGQHMAQKAVTGQSAQPMPVRVSAWAVYDVFHCKGDDQVFVGVVSDGQWQTFCRHFGLDDLANDPELKENSNRVGKRDMILPIVQARFMEMDKAELMAELDQCGVPFAPIGKPDDLFDDPHLNASGGLLELDLPDGGETRLPALPLQLGEERLGVRSPVPHPGADGDAVLKALGMSDEDIQSLIDDGVAQVPGKG
ncbi:MAG: CaiB/BaiF CoA transferase family protein [Lysobacterales bacterium]